jgi:hypothetical protein
MVRNFIAKLEGQLGNEAQVDMTKFMLWWQKNKSNYGTQFFKKDNYSAFKELSQHIDDAINIGLERLGNPQVVMYGKKAPVTEHLKNINAVWAKQFDNEDLLKAAEVAMPGQAGQVLEKATSNYGELAKKLMRQRGEDQRISLGAYLDTPALPTGYTGGRSPRLETSVDQYLLERLRDSMTQNSRTGKIDPEKLLSYMTKKNPEYDTVKEVLTTPHSQQYPGSYSGDVPTEAIPAARDAAKVLASKKQTQKLFQTLEDVIKDEKYYDPYGRFSKEGNTLASILTNPLTYANYSKGSVFGPLGTGSYSEMRLDKQLSKKLKEKK